MSIRSFAFATLICGTLSAHGETITIEVKAGEHDREGTPLVLNLPVDLKRQGDALLTTESATGDPVPVPVQIIPGGRTRVIWMLERSLKAGDRRRYTLDLRIRAKSDPAEENSVEKDVSSLMHCLETEGTIELLHGSDSILQYLKQPSPDAARNEPAYTRTGYIHPLHSPAGRTITGDYAADHPHQHGLFFAWTNTSFEGRDINFWDQKSEKARISYESTVKTLSGPVFSQFVAMQLHEDLTAPGGPKPVLNERWMVRAYRTAGDFYLVDIQSRQTCSGQSPLVINQYHYGGMAIRGADDWFVNEKNAKQPSDFLTSDGKTRADGNHSQPNWVDLHGGYPDGGHAGVAILGHPENFRAPQPVRLHPSKPYFVFTPQVESGFSIEPGKAYLSRYRYLIHDGAPDPELIERIWRDYAEPPVVALARKL